MKTFVFLAAVCVFGGCGGSGLAPGQPPSYTGDLSPAAPTPTPPPSDMAQPPGSTPTADMGAPVADLSDPPAPDLAETAADLARAVADLSDPVADLAQATDLAQAPDLTPPPPSCGAIGEHCCSTSVQPTWCDLPQDQAYCTNTSSSGGQVIGTCQACGGLDEPACPGLGCQMPFVNRGGRCLSPTCATNSACCVVGSCHDPMKNCSCG